MNPEEIKNSIIFKKLKENKRAQASAKRLGATNDWKVLQQLVIEIKQALMEAAFESSKIEENLKDKYLVRGMEGVIILPSLVDLVNEMAKEDESKKEQEAEDAKRRKYNPGAYIQKAVSKLKGVR